MIGCKIKLMHFITMQWLIGSRILHWKKNLLIIYWTHLMMLVQMKMTTLLLFPLTSSPDDAERMPICLPSQFSNDTLDGLFMHNFTKQERKL